MTLDISVNLSYKLQAPADLLVQIETAYGHGQTVEASDLELGPHEHQKHISAEDGIGQRLWVRADGDFTCRYTAHVNVARKSHDLQKLRATEPHQLPGAAVRYLMPSRYCPSDEFQTFVADEFGNLSGGERIVSMRNWIESAFSYVPGSSNAQTTALDSFVQRQGICRDYAHVMITLARASSIPARFASVYAPYVDPPDFHAVAEIYLDGDWHLVDPTGMAAPEEIAVIGVGSDAAEVAFLTSFGRVFFLSQSVSVTRA